VLLKDIDLDRSSKQGCEKQKLEMEKLKFTHREIITSTAPFMSPDPDGLV
jgi:hypothetical protein